MRSETSSHTRPVTHHQKKTSSYSARKRNKSSYTTKEKKKIGKYTKEIRRGHHTLKKKTGKYENRKTSIHYQKNKKEGKQLAWDQKKKFLPRTQKGDPENAIRV